MKNESDPASLRSATASYKKPPSPLPMSKLEFGLCSRSGVAARACI